MGRHIVVSFNNTAQAEAFIAAMGTEGAVFYQGEDTHFKNIDVSTTKVVASFWKAEVFCQCDYSAEHKYVRGSTYGAYVHDVCKRPEGGHHQSALKNLLIPGKDSGRWPEKKVNISIREGVHRWPEPKVPKEG